MKGGAENRGLEGWILTGLFSWLGLLSLLILDVKTNLAVINSKLHISKADYQALYGRPGGKGGIANPSLPGSPDLPLEEQPKEDN